MSWLSDFLGMKKIRTPLVRKAESIDFGDDEYNVDAYLRDLMNKSGYEKTIITGSKRPMSGIAWRKNPTPKRSMGFLV